MLFDCDAQEMLLSQVRENPCCNTNYGNPEERNHQNLDTEITNARL